MKNVFKTKLSTASLVLIPACIGINYLGKLFASVLKLPLWLDSIGTCIGGALGGPIIGAICGAANNLIYGFTTGDSITLVYALTSLGIGLAVGIMARLGNMEKISGALITSVIAGLVENPVVAVPTSVGYGASFHGLSALLTMLNSCANGISVVNIDNGYGAGYLAAQINRLAAGKGDSQIK